MGKLREFYKSFHPIVHTLLLGIILVSVARGMSIPFLAIYLAKTTDLDPAQIGLIIGVGAIAYLWRLYRRHTFRFYRP